MGFKHPPLLDDTDKRSLLALAKTTLFASFSNDPHGPLRAYELALPQHSKTLREARPCFVTLTSMGNHLRGCIGTLETENPLYANVHEFTLKAAFSDPRFPPLKQEELEVLKIEITVLGPILPLPNLNSLVIGQHGLVVESGHHRGVLLAQVPVEWNWDKEEFVRQACHKAGLSPENQASYKLSYFEEIAFSEERS